MKAERIVNKDNARKTHKVKWWPQRVANTAEIALLIYALIYKQYSNDLHKLAVNFQRTLAACGNANVILDSFLCLFIRKELCSFDARNFLSLHIPLGYWGLRQEWRKKKMETGRMLLCSIGCLFLYVFTFSSPLLWTVQSHFFSIAACLSSYVKLSHTHI